jgi:hypothetical protein
VKNIKPIETPVSDEMQIHQNYGFKKLSYSCLKLVTLIGMIYSNYEYHGMKMNSLPIFIECTSDELII